MIEMLEGIRYAKHGSTVITKILIPKFEYPYTRMNNQSYQSNYGQFQTPPPPRFDVNQRDSGSEFAPNCIKCGATNNVSMRKFKKKYVSPVAVLGVFIGLLPYFLFRLLLTTTHDLSAPFCERCWKGRFEKVAMVNQLTLLGVVASVFLGIVIAVNLSSPLIFFIIFGLGISGAIFGRVFEWRTSPKYKKVNDKIVVIDAPVVGEIIFTK